MLKTNRPRHVDKAEQPSEGTTRPTTHNSRPTNQTLTAQFLGWQLLQFLTDVHQGSNQLLFRHQSRSLHCNMDGRICFNLMIHSTHFCILRLYCIVHIIKVHSDSDRGNLQLPLHGLLFPISNKGFFYMRHPRQDSTYHSLCYTSCEALVGTIGDRSTDPSHDEQTLLPQR